MGIHSTDSTTGYPQLLFGWPMGSCHDLAFPSMTTSLARPAHWDDPDPVPGFRLQRRRSDLGVGEIWEAVARDGSPVLVRLVDVADDAASRAKAGRLAGALPLLGHTDLDPVR